MLGVDGPTLLDDEPDTHTFDYANIDAPIFFCNTVKHYLFIQELSRSRRPISRRVSPAAIVSTKTS